MNFKIKSLTVAKCNLTLGSTSEMLSFDVETYRYTDADTAKRQTEDMCPDRQTGH